MNGLDFFKRVDEHKDLEWLGCRGGSSLAEAFVFVVYLPTRRRFRIPLRTVLDDDWKLLESILTEKRPIRVLHQMTRIVGYYSVLHNWNRSKLAENIDRDNGTYGVPDAHRIPELFPAGDVEPVVAEALVTDGAEYACQIASENR